jgi:hypothetical protein
MRLHGETELSFKRACAELKVHLLKARHHSQKINVHSLVWSCTSATPHHHLHRLSFFSQLSILVPFVDYQILLSVYSLSPSLEQQLFASNGISVKDVMLFPRRRGTGVTVFFADAEELGRAIELCEKMRRQFSPQVRLSEMESNFWQSWQQAS